MSDSNLCNMQSCCRLCLTTDELVTLKSVFDETFEDCALPQKILQYVGIEINEADEISTVVCSQCITRVIGFHTYKEQCTLNQVKLKKWPMSSDQSVNMDGIAEASFHVKEEPVGDDDNSSIVSEVDEIRIEMIQAKNELMDHSDAPMDEEYNELPPVLSPHRPDPKLMQNRSIGIPSKQKTGVLEQQTSEDPSQLKMQFASGSELLTSVTTIAGEALSNIELSYIEKCKALVNMHQTLVCACHNIPHQNARGLMSHLRALRIWFPVFTCYSCMITFTDRSTFGKHIKRCPRKSLAAITKLGNLTKRSDVKIRLYQNFKCTICKFTFSFHEDFCNHVDEKHASLTFPFQCKCRRIFDDVEAYKDHIHISCLVNFYCDICFITTKTLEDFQKHASNVHDNSVGFILLQDDEYRTKKPLTDVVAEEILQNGGNLTENWKGSASIITSMIGAKKHAGQSQPTSTENSSKSAKFYSCKYCNTRFGRSATLEKHVQQNHKDFLQKGEEKVSVIYDRAKNSGSNFVEECGKSFQVQTELKQHRREQFKMEVNSNSKRKLHKRTAISPISNEKELGNDKDGIMKYAPPEVSVESSATINKKMQKCDLCDKEFGTSSGLLDHKKRIHQKRKTLLSKSFSKKFSNWDEIRRCELNHEETNVNIIKTVKKNNSLTEYHKCNRCYKIFSTEHNMKNHMKCHETITNPAAKVIRKSKCNDSQHVLKTTKEVAKHKNYGKGNVSNEKQAHISCKYCEISFYSNASLTKHMNEEHDEAGNPKTTGAKPEKKLACTMCAKSFQTIAALASHIGWHKRGQNENNTKLMRPDKVLLVLAHNANMIQKPTDEPKFQCATCSAELPNDIALQIHTLEEHRNINDIMLIPRCDTCNKDFTTQDEYEMHKRIHEFLERKKQQEQNISIQQQEESQVVPIKMTEQNEIAVQSKLTGTEHPPNLAKHLTCQYCSAEFSKSDTLRKHVRRKHKEFNKTDFKCTQCNRIFEKQSSLTIHLKIHEKHRVV